MTGGVHPSLGQPDSRTGMRAVSQSNDPTAAAEDGDVALQRTFRCGERHGGQTTCEARPPLGQAEVFTRTPSPDNPTAASECGLCLSRTNRQPCSNAAA